MYIYDIIDTNGGRGAHMDERKKYERQYRYSIKNVVQVKLSLVRTTDADIIEKLDQVGNKQGYIKDLIRKNIAEEAKKND